MSAYKGKVGKYYRLNMKRVHLEWKPASRHPTHLSLTPERIFQREKNTFIRLKERLLGDPTYSGKYVGIVGGRMVDSDSDENVLAQRIYARYGYIPIYIEKIEPEEEVLEVPSPELT